jgi:peptidoglycan hydrolase CwlO-like protein
METSSNLYSVFTVAISVLGSIVITYLTKVYQRRTEKRRQPKDRIETIFDGYDALIAQIRSDLSRKDELIENLQKVVDSQGKEILRSQGLIGDLQEQLKQSAVQISRLQTQLEGLRTMSEKGTQ